jgi:hypothetical protein
MRSERHTDAPRELPTPAGEGPDCESANENTPARETPTSATVAIVRFARAVVTRPKEAAVLGVVMIMAIIAGYVFGGAGASIFFGVVTAVAAANWIVLRERRERVRRGKGRIMW